MATVAEIIRHSKQSRHDIPVYLFILHHLNIEKASKRVSHILRNHGMSLSIVSSSLFYFNFIHSNKSVWFIIKQALI